MPGIESPDTMHQLNLFNFLYIDYNLVNNMSENKKIKAKFLDEILNYCEKRSSDELNMSCIALAAAHIKLLAFWLMRSHTHT